MNHRLLVACAAAALVAMPADAQASRFLNPPGNSGINQYTEVVPSASGNIPTSGGTGLGNSGPGAVLPAAVRQALRGSGTEVKALSQFVAATRPARAALPGDGVAVGMGESRLGSLALGGGGGMGLALPLIMAAGLLLALLLLLARRRRARS